MAVLPLPARLPVPDPAAVAALVPGNALRAGINTSNFLLVNGRNASGEPVGVSPSLAAALAEALGVPIQFVTFASPGELADAVTEDTWDIANIGSDPARAAHIAFTPAYAEIEATYVVRHDSPFERVEDVDRAGVTVVSKARAAYTLWLERHLEHATLTQTASADESLSRFAAGDADVLAGLLPRLLTDAERLRDCRRIEGRFTAVQQAVGTPRDRNPAGIEYLRTFVAAAIRSGLVADLISLHNIRGLSVVVS